MNTTTQERYIPTGYAPIVETDQYCAYGDETRKLAIFYRGKSRKPLFHNRFLSVESMEKKIQNTIKAIHAREAEKKQRAQERKQPHTLKTGDILYTSWGYEQTNVDFYEVTKVVSGRSVKIRAIKSTIDHSEAFCDYVMPIRGAFVGAEELKRVQHGNYIKIASYANAFVWDGKPKYQTAAGFGH